MPVIKSAKKKLRQDKKRTERNRNLKVQLKDLIKKVSKTKSPEALRDVFTTADKAAKNHIIHKNKAARLKSRAAKLLSGAEAPKATLKKASKKKTK